MSAEKPNPCNLERGAVVGWYEIVGRVGEGGFGYIFKVRRDGKVYALKISRQRHGDLPPGEREHYEERLHREIAALTSLHHPNIVRVHSFDRWPDLEDGYPYLVMDLVEGSCLDDWRVEKRPSLAQICVAFERIASAVAHMHGLGIYHRDLKSANVLVRKDGEPILVDFGIARPRNAYVVTRAASVGTLANYSPEYAEYCDSEAFGREPFEWRPTTDLHSLGYMLYEALTDEPPFPVGSELSEAVILDAIKTRVPRPPSELNAAVPAVLDGIVLRLLKKRPASRLQSAGELAEMLRQAREEAGKAWEVPVQIPESGMEAGPGEAEALPPAGEDPDEEGESIPTVLRNAGESRVIARRAESRGETPAREGARPAAPGRVPFDVPPIARQPAFVEEGPATVKEVPREVSGGLPSAIREMKAQLAATARRRAPWPLLAGGGIVALVVTLFIVAGMSGGPPANGPTALFTASGEPAASPGGSALQVGSDTTTTEPRLSGGLVHDLADQAPTAGGKVSPAQAPEGKPARKTKARLRGRSETVPAERAPILTASARPARSGFLRSRPLEAGKARNVAAGTVKPLGVPLGAHIRAKLLTNLDSRTIGVGPVEAELTAPVVVRGEIVLPARTLAYGTASEGSDRFNVRFTRLRLADYTEIAFEGLALARDEGKPGLAAGRRIEGALERHDGLGAKIAKGTGNILLDTITGGTAQDIARSAGQAALSQAAPATGGSGAVLLLDAGVVFDIFVEHSF